MFTDIAKYLWDGERDSEEREKLQTSPSEKHHFRSVCRTSLMGSKTKQASKQTNKQKPSQNYRLLSHSALGKTENPTPEIQRTRSTAGI